MGALLFTIGMFAYWFLLGMAVQAVAPPKVKPLTAMLIAPALGVAVFILPVFLISRIGVPVGMFALPLSIVLGVAAIAILFWRRIELPWRSFAPVGVTLAVGLALVAWPMALFSFDWMSFGNDDMANYALGAQRFLNHGYFEQPNVEEWASGRDYSLAYYSMHVLSRQRSGSELMLAAVWGTSGLNSHYVFMPTIMSLHLVLGAGVAAMVSENTESRLGPPVAAAIFALSPLSSLGALYQLIGQVGGLGLLVSSLLLTLRNSWGGSLKETAIQNIPAGLVFCGLVIWYPEVGPFFGVSWLFYLAFVFFRRKGVAALREVIIPAGVIAVITAVLLNTYAIDAVLFMLVQGGSATADIALSATLFPYYLIPTGPATILGMLPVATAPLQEPFWSLTILAGLILCGVFTVRAVMLFWSGFAPAITLVVMILVGLFLFSRQQDFALYKVAMYLQPFLIAVVARDLVKVATMKRLQGVPRVAVQGATGVVTAGVLLMNASSQQGYAGKSTGETYGGFIEVPHVSKEKMNRRFQETLAAIPPDATLILDAPNVVIGKFSMLYTRGRQSLLPLGNYVGQIARRPTVMSKANRIGENEFAVNGTAITAALATARVLAANFTAILNQFSRNHDIKGSFEEVKDLGTHLFFIDSKLGGHYYLGQDLERKSLYQVERNPLSRTQDFSALGRYLLTMTLKQPPEGTRAMVELTSTVLVQFDRSVPPVTVQGEPFGAVGRGAARLFSQPVKPTLLDGLYYLTFDLGRDGRQFPNRIIGLDGIYGRDIPRDRRMIAAFGSDLSLVTAEQYANLKRPSAVGKFPEGLLDKGLEFSGVYEDGWIAERSFFVLAHPAAGPSDLVIEGGVPQIDDKAQPSTMTVKANGRVVASAVVGPGNFALRAPVPPSDGPVRLDISFDRSFLLGGEDGRPASAQMSKIALEAPSDAPVADYADPAKIKGIYADQWVSSFASVPFQTPSTARAVVLSGMVPQIGDRADFSTVMTVELDGKVIASPTLTPGEFAFELPTAIAKGEHVLTLSFSRRQTLPGGDGRLASARILSIGFR